MRGIRCRNTFYHPERMIFPPSPRRGAEEDDSDEDEDEDEEEEEEDGVDPSSGAGEPETTRAERRELKKKQAERANKSGPNDGDGDDPDDLIANPNHVTKKLNISDLSAPRELTRRERYVTSVLFILTIPPFLTFFFLRREQKEKKEAKERYWKVNALIRSLLVFFCLDLILILCVCLCTSDLLPHSPILLAACPGKDRRS